MAPREKSVAVVQTRRSGDGKGRLRKTKKQDISSQGFNKFRFRPAMCLDMNGQAGFSSDMLKMRAIAPTSASRANTFAGRSAQNCTDGLDMFVTFKPWDGSNAEQATTHKQGPCTKRQLTRLRYRFPFRTDHSPQVRRVSAIPTREVVSHQVRRVFTGAGLVPPVERTFAIIKPDAVTAGKAEAIIQR